jgi:hypothetical protein
MSALFIFRDQSFNKLDALLISIQSMKTPNYFCSEGRSFDQAREMGFGTCLKDNVYGCAALGFG